MIRPVIDPLFAQNIFSRYLFTSAQLLPATMTFRQEKEADHDYANDYQTIQQITQNYQQELIFNLKVNLNFLGNMLQKTLRAASIGRAEKTAGNEIRTILNQSVEKARQTPLQKPSQTIQLSAKPENWMKTEPSKETSQIPLQHANNRKFGDWAHENAKKQAEFPVFSVKTGIESQTDTKLPELIPQQRVFLNPQQPQPNDLRQPQTNAKTEPFIREKSFAQQSISDFSVQQTAETRDAKHEHEIPRSAQKQTVIQKLEHSPALPVQADAAMPALQNDPAQLLHRKVPQQENSVQPEQSFPRRKDSAFPEQIHAQQIPKEPERPPRTIREENIGHIRRIQQLYERTFARFEKAQSEARPAQLALRHSPVLTEDERRQAVQPPDLHSAGFPEQKHPQRNESRTKYSERTLHRLRLLSDDKIPDPVQKQNIRTLLSRISTSLPVQPISLQHRQVFNPLDGVQHTEVQRENLQIPLLNNPVQRTQPAKETEPVSAAKTESLLQMHGTKPLKLRYKQQMNLPVLQQRSILKKGITPVRNITPQTMPLQHMTDRRPEQHPAASYAGGTAAVQMIYSTLAVDEQAPGLAVQQFPPAVTAGTVQQTTRQIHQIYRMQQMHQMQQSLYAASHAQILYRQLPAAQEKPQREENAPHDIETIRRVIKEEKSKQEINEKITAVQPSAKPSVGVQTETLASVKSVNQIADQVYDILERRLRFEQIRRGGF